MNSICMRVKTIRKEWGLSQVEFAKRLGVTNSHISGIEKGKTVPSEALIKLICKEYLITEKWLKTGVEPMLQEDEDTETENSIDEMFSEDPLRDVGINISHESNRVRLLWAQMELHHKKILAQNCDYEDERFAYFSLCEKLFRDLSEMVDGLRTGNSNKLQFSFKGEEVIPMTLIYKDLVAKDIDRLEEYITSHKP